MSVYATISNGLALASIGIALFAAWPGIIRNIRNKESGGYNLMFLTMWMVGNLFVVTSVLLVPIEPVQMFLRFYYLFTECTSDPCAGREARDF
jgi:hypothetical protein